MKFQLHKTKIPKSKKFLALSLSDVVFITLINVKMRTIVGILTFKSRIFVLSLIDHENSFITSGPVLSSTAKPNMLIFQIALIVLL